MRFFARITVAAAAIALAGGVVATAASAHDVRVRVGTPKPYYHYRQPTRYYYQPPVRRYYAPPPRRYYVEPRRNFLNCRWVPHRGRVCW